MDSQPSRPSFTSQPGALFTTLSTERKVKAYAVVQPELEQLTMLNSGSLLFFSIGSLFAGYAVDLLRDLFVKEAHTSVETCIGFGVIAAICYVVGAICVVKRGSVVKEITSRSEPRS